MNRLFNPENKFWNFVGKLADVACMSFLWLICSVPIITTGAATTAFYAFTLHQVTDTEGGVIRSFFHAFRQYGKKATLICLLQLCGSAFLLWDLWACWQFYTMVGSVVSLVIGSFCACFTLLFLCVFLYIYPILALYDFPLKKLFKDSFIMAVGNLHVTITLLALLGLMFVGVYYMSMLFFFWFGFYVFFSSYFITGVFLRYTGEQESRPGLMERLTDLTDRIRGWRK